MVNRSGSTKRRLNETQHREFKTHKMGMQISCGVHPEVSQEKHLWVCEKKVRADHPDLAQQKESVVEEGHLMADHVHMLLSIPPKYSVSGWWGLSRARVPLRSHEGSWIGRRTLWDRTFGRGAITCQRWGGMKRRSEST